MSELRPLLDGLVGDEEWARHQALERLRARGLPPDDIDALAGELAGDDPSRRAGARMALAALASPGCPAADLTRDRLLAALRSRDGDLRILAATAMGESGHAGFVPPLVESLDDADPNLVAAAAEALGELGHPSALHPLAALAGHPGFWVRTAAVVALGRLRDPAALPALRHASATPGIEGVLVEAVRAIGDAGGLDILASAHPGLPLPALRAAGSILSVRSDVTAPSWVVEGARARARELLGLAADQDDPAVGRLLGLAATPETIAALVRLAGPPRRSEAAINGLLAVPPDQRADPILDAIVEADPPELVTLLSLLPPLERRDRIRRLLPLLSHAEPPVRAAAAEALARSPTEYALPLLTDAFRSGPVAPEVVRAAGGLSSSACVALLPLLDDPDPAVRAAAADALGRCAEPSVAAVLDVTLDREDDPDARRALLRSIGRVARERAIATLAPALTDPDPETRLAVIEALGSTGSEAAVPHLRRALEGEPGEVLAAIRALGDVAGLPAAAALEPWLRSADLEQRRTAVRSARAVVRYLDPATLEGLAADADAWIRTWAARLLGEHGATGRDTLERLASHDPDPAVRTEARKALAAMSS